MAIKKINGWMASWLRMSILQKAKISVQETLQETLKRDLQNSDRHDPD